MRYALLICADETAAITEQEGVRLLAAYASFAIEMQACGVLADGGVRLQPTSTATSVRLRDGDIGIADGPFAETKEQIGAFYLVDCADLDEAIEVAAKVPAAARGSIEVRPVWEM
jgi:hypothetical protein